VQAPPLPSWPHVGGGASWGGEEQWQSVKLGQLLNVHVYAAVACQSHYERQQAKPCPPLKKSRSRPRPHLDALPCTVQVLEREACAEAATGAIAAAESRGSRLFLERAFVHGGGTDPRPGKNMLVLSLKMVNPGGEGVGEARGRRGPGRLREDVWCRLYRALARLNVGE